jgi:XTP/dITP diphosphohydrolase
MKIVFATNNQNKLREMQALASAGIEFVTPHSLGYDFFVEETGTTFRENALLKARACYDACGLPALGDDSGLVVRVLDGRPGVYSAHYAGEHGNDAANIRLVLEELAALEAKGNSDRAAAFVCTLAFVNASGQEYFFEGQVAGELTKDLRGTGGFGYDPIFYVPEKKCTMAELPLAEKNRLSHRARAVQAFFAWLGADAPAGTDDASALSAPAGTTDAEASTGN